MNNNIYTIDILCVYCIVRTDVKEYTNNNDIYWFNICNNRFSKNGTGVSTE